MKSILYFFLAAWAITFLGCAKDGINTLKGGTSLTLVDAIVGSNNLVTNFTGTSGSKVPDTLSYYATATQIGFGNWLEFSGYIGQTPLSLSPITDTSLALWSGILTLPMNTIHSLFVIGPDSLHVDTLFTTDNPIPHPVTDSNMGVRFVNLSPGSSPVSVDLQGNTPGSITASLPYKGITSFADFPVNAETPDTYIFEFRDAASGTLLSQLEIDGLSNGTNGNTGKNQYRWHNFTICLFGLPNGQQTMLVNNY